MSPSFNSPLEILALTIIGEARGEGIAGQVAVGCVIRNRLHSNPEKYKNFSGVCLEPKQFSCWNKDDSNFAYLTDLGEKMIDNQSMNDPIIRQCILVANGISNYDLIDNTKGAKYYVVTSLLISDKAPSWSRNRKNSLEIGHQTFFSL